MINFKSIITNSNNFYYFDDFYFSFFDKKCFIFFDTKNIEKIDFFFEFKKIKSTKIFIIEENKILETFYHKEKEKSQIPLELKKKINKFITSYFENKTYIKKKNIYVYLEINFDFYDKNTHISDRKKIHI